ncbi:cAMP-dependent protein kinase catalytic subunit beta-like [Macrosteles quadrilineatus]|uniref:cAMP-dependent protein kinase catalytic subunit beta-like n=1 Tax=Macrosteles quadrilineatus TaxID=74068 RepID=UPI0023E1210A|nr:cAMP-dependent protein kinase catalytic subunit beta-like [Macrosteles quadrilineatus]
MASTEIERSHGTSLKKGKLSEKDLLAKFPDSGSLDIENFANFMKSSKEIFYEKWSLPSSFFKRPASLEEFVKLKLLGKGSFGFVALAKHKPSEKLYALKCVDKDEVIKHRQVENLKTEQGLMQCINYPFTIYLIYTFKDNCYIYFVLPFVEGGDLYRHMQAIGPGSEDQARFYACQIILALEYLHHLDFVYRDLKPENILLDHTGYLKLADFGFTKRLKRRLRTYTLCGTPEYMAPEIILNKGYGKSVDWWAAGCFIYEMVAGATPFVASDAGRIYEKIIYGKIKFPQTFSQGLKDLVGKMVQADLSKRFGNLKNGANDIKEHKWFLATNWLAVLNRKCEAPYRPKIGSVKEDGTTPWKLPKEGKVEKYSKEFEDF